MVTAQDVRLNRTLQIEFDMCIFGTTSTADDQVMG